jgi:hypothetical protein
MIYPDNKSGLCKNCVMTDPLMKAKRSAALRKRVAQDPEILYFHVAHIPPSLRDEYRLLRSGKRFNAAEVTAMLREAHPAAFAAHERKMEARRSNEAQRYMAYRVRMLPVQLEAARRKVQALENEARRLDMHDLLESRP